MNKQIIGSLAICALVVGWAFWLVSRPSTAPVGNASPVATTTAEGAQIIDIVARGGYTPRVVVAKAGVPTVLRVTTNGTFDCSASLVIPRLSYQKFLQPSGTEDIAISAEAAHGTLQGTCAMGMYGFQIQFQ